MTQEEKLAKVKEDIEAISKILVINAEMVADDFLKCGALEGSEHPLTLAKYALRIASERAISFIKKEEKELSNLSKFI